MKALDKLKQAFAKQADAARSVQETVEAVRDQIIATGNDLAQLRATPEPQASAETALDREIANHMAAAQAALSREVAGLSGIARRPVMNLDPSPEEALSLQIALNPQGFRKLIAAELAEFYKGREAMPRDQRDARIKEIEAELLALETTEEGMIRQAEAAGIEILRRANADPRAVLALIEN